MPLASAEYCASSYRPLKRAKKGNSSNAQLLPKKRTLQAVQMRKHAKLQVYVIEVDVPRIPSLNELLKHEVAEQAGTHHPNVSCMEWCISICML